MIFLRIAQNISTAPNSFDVVFAFCRSTKILAQLADKYVDDFQLWFVHTAIQMVQGLPDHLCGRFDVFVPVENPRPDLQKLWAFAQPTPLFQCARRNLPAIRQLFLCHLAHGEPHCFFHSRVNSTCFAKQRYRPAGAKSVNMKITSVTSTGSNYLKTCR